VTGAAPFLPPCRGIFRRPSGRLQPRNRRRRKPANPGPREPVRPGIHSLRQYAAPQASPEACANAAWSSAESSATTSHRRTRNLDDFGGPFTEPQRRRRKARLTMITGHDNRLPQRSIIRLNDDGDAYAHRNKDANPAGETPSGFDDAPGRLDAHGKDSVSDPEANEACRPLSLSDGGDEQHPQALRRGCSYEHANLCKRPRWLALHDA
jgi:hypothetical protein